MEKVVFKPAEPVAPKTPVEMSFVYTDKYQNDTNAVTYRILPTSRKSSLNLDVRLLNPQSRAFQQLVGNYSEQQLGVLVDQMGNKRTELGKKQQNLKGEEAQKMTREIDGISLQMWYVEFFLKVHKKAALHYHVVADVGGQELVLVSTK
jgi:hypothetical protein